MSDSNRYGYFYFKHAVDLQIFLQWSIIVVSVLRLSLAIQMIEKFMVVVKQKCEITICKD